MAAFTHDEFIAALESKLDYLSAKTIAKVAFKETGLGEKAKYAGADADALIAVVKSEGGARGEAACSSLESPAAAKEPAAKPAKEPAAKPAKEPAAKPAEKAAAAKKDAPATKQAPAAKDAAKAAAKKKS